ncbi:hypothetical protein [Desulfovibrio gilichinskyi]|uniref:Uncharacterized protein n=1 Tax=Desulfovibrio gilichinskyi TaxID=1519643 RepID=A0A1X7C3P6_9BACT|nr:hypothetical protein [Desulfovibrio gilichinskyi]SME89305.1 hypothetical protein SAMN06295933_0269 [Desulfovibrio gilichinskyi]
MANNDLLHNQLIRLGDMMGDGLHLEPGGKWIEKEYGKIVKALGIVPKRKRYNNSIKINEAMLQAVVKFKCKCGGNLKQTRSGSMIGKCSECGNRYRLLKIVKRKAAKAEE